MKQSLRTVSTRDGHKLSIRHFAPDEDDGLAPSVILLHGFAQNHHTFSLPRRSFAAHLVEHGFHAFVGELRGRSHALPHHRHGFHDYVEDDAAALIASVVENRPQAPLFFVGHSMGALIGAALPPSSREHVRAMILMAPPFMFLEWFRSLRAVGREGLRVLHRSLRHPLPTRIVGPLLNVWRPVLDAPWMPLLMPVWAPGSMEPELLEMALKDTFAHEGPRVLSDLLELGLTKGREAGGVPFLERLRSLEMPLLVAAGDKDGLAPPRIVRPLYERAGSHEKELVVFGKRAGGHPCGHLDMVVGRHAPDEVWPVLVAFLEAQRRKGSAPQKTLARNRGSS